MLDYIGNNNFAFLLLALLTPASLISLFLFSVLSIKASREHASVPLPLPWVGRKNQLFASIRANYRGFVKSVELFTSGYRTYSKKDQTYVVPTWTKGPQVIVPPAYGNWIASRPDALLNAKDCTFETAQFTYTVGHPEITSNDMIDILIKRELTRTIGSLNNEILEEVNASMIDIFGTSGEWVDVGVFDSLTRTVGRAANRVFVGAELCSDMEYLMAGVHFARDISVSSYILHAFPRFLRPFVALFATYPNRRHAKICMRYLEPLIAERIDNMKRKERDPSYAWEVPEDFITWMVRESLKRKTEDERSVYALAYRVVLLQFAAITTSTIMSTNALLDIWSAPNTEELVDSLRDEASRVLAEHNGEWSKAALAKLYRLDSAIRESSRVSGVGGTALARKVKPDNGITLPNGLWLPKGSTVGVSMDGIHFDEAFYEDPSTFDAFRFSRPREDPSYDEKGVNEDLVTTSPHWLTFSHGIHACPGRHFAVNNIKMILAQLLLNYDVKPFDTRPPNFSIGDLSVVPVKARMKIRRRQIKA
ncbi:unnamed protein product [Somion occarium]|uniref:Cytochrome P450 n=1 Tax=Somion occarium TaxID=3059160 RepID=A0ABP1D646_9APHY